MSILGDYESDEVIGDDEVMGEEGGYEVVGAGRVLRGVRRAPARRLLRLPARPDWRRELAPGVPAPAEGLEPLPLQPRENAGVFDAGNPAITFEGRPQAPFRAERLIVSVTRSAGAALVRILGQGIFVGRELQLLELNNFDIEFFQANAFGVRLKLAQAQPGVLIRIPCVNSIAVAPGESVQVNMIFLGRSIRA
jgi:hypothetical protein